MCAHKVYSGIQPLLTLLRCVCNEHCLLCASTVFSDYTCTLFRVRNASHYFTDQSYKMGRDSSVLIGQYEQWIYGHVRRIPGQNFLNNCFSIAVFKIYVFMALFQYYGRPFRLSNILFI